MSNELQAGCSLHNVPPVKQKYLIHTRLNITELLHLPSSPMFELRLEVEPKFSSYTKLHKRNPRGDTTKLNMM